MALTPGQQACVSMLDAPVAVSAGAGSGKTFTLTRRIVHAIETGAARGIDDVLAITFTSKAAGEIKARVKSALSAAGFADDARAVDGAWISTIHGMCSRILREHAVELGLDPSFCVVEGSEADRMRDAAIDEALASANDMVSPSGLDALFAEYPARSAGPAAGGSIEDMLKQILNLAATSPHGLDAVETKPAPRSGTVLLSQLADCARTCLELAQAEKDGKLRNAFVDGTADALAAAEDALASPEGVTADRALRLMAAFPFPGSNFGSKTGGYKLYVGEAKDIFSECVTEARLAAAHPLLRDLLTLARAVAASYARRKREIGALDNNDLLVMAARALDERPEIARSYVGRFSVIMVDEFQDTDQMQVDMIKRIAGKGWRRLCTVGDAQQSIYRFRGADVSVFRRHVADVGEANPDGLITLFDNFRSHADVLAFVDRVFEQPRVFGGSFMSLSAGRDERRVEVPFKGEGPRIDVFDVAYRGIRSIDACRFEADCIAQRFADLIAAGHTAKDMVVLLGTMTRADEYASALRRHGMACVVLKGSVFNRAPEVRVMVRLAYVVANPAYTSALFEVLSSGMFDLSADDFIELSTYYDDERGFDRRQSIFDGACRLARAAAETPSQVPRRLRAALSLLSRVRRQTGRRPVSRIMADAVRDSGWLTRLEAQGAEGQAQAGNILKALRLVESIEAEGGIGPLAVARRFEHAVEVSREAPGALSAKAGDFVRIMTVHASKGLEFPIVAIAEMAERADAGGKLVCRASGGRLFVSLDAGYSLDSIADRSCVRRAREAKPFAGLDEDELASAFDHASTAYEARAAASAASAAGDAAERKRLMYVAVTRAKEAVIVAMRAKASDKTPSGISLENPGVYGDIQAALAPAGEPVPQGVTMVDFGGSRPARLERIDVDEEAYEAFLAQLADAPGTCGSASGPDAGCRQEALYLPVSPVGIAEGPATPLRERVFSYSSVSTNHSDEPAGGPEPAAPPSDGVAELAIGADAPSASAAAAFGSAACAGPLDPDEAAWADIRAALSDDDKATDLGTAFHRLAQLAVIARPAGGSLRRPSADRVDALCRACRVTPGQRARLEAALDRWFSSDIAKRAAAWDSLEAEVPFFVRIDVDGAPAYLEGEIDLLATDAARKGALVVDYKTGGFADETPDRLHDKHLLQALCYAYAVLLQGFAQVELVFVRVEQIDDGAEGGLLDDLRVQGKGPGASPEPQCVRYAFTSADLPDIVRSIADRASGKI